MKKYRVEVEINVFEVDGDEEEIACTLSGESQTSHIEKMLETMAYLLNQQNQTVRELLARQERF